VSIEVQRTGAEIQKQTTELDTKRREEQTSKNRAQRKAREQGISTAALVSDPERANRSIELLERARRKEEKREDEIEDGNTTAAPAPAKTYILKSAPVADVATLRRKIKAAWNRVEKSGATVNRHALTQKILGHHHSWNEFTAEECDRMLKVFTAIARDAKKKGAS
jgi:hypothetical protein